MADEILDSHEQGEQVRKWLEKNATSIVVGLLVGLLAVFGGKRWSESQTVHRGEAMEQYQKMIAPDIDSETFDAHFKALTGSYADTPYAGLATLAKAERLIVSADSEAAIAQLRQAAAEASPAGVNSVARLRLARVLIAADQSDEALRQLESIQTAGFRAAIAEVRGDALAHKGDRAAAETAYDSALSYMDVAAPGRDMVEMKLGDVASAVIIAQVSEAPETVNDEAETEAETAPAEAAQDAASGAAEEASS